MGQAIGEALPFAIGVAISPVPIIAIILMLLSARAGANSLAFLAGWILGVTGASVVLLALTSQANTESTSAPSTASGVIKMVLGVLCLALAWRNVRKQSGADGHSELPGWLTSIESITPAKSFALGVVLSAVNPKNVLMIAGAMAVIAPYDLPGSDLVVVVAVFVLIAISTVLAPVIVYRFAGDRAQPLLDALRDWLSKENAIVMAVLMAVIGAVLIGKGISALA